MTPGQLSNTHLLVVSDLTELTQKQPDVLKRLLGRDTFTLEEKFQSEYGMIAPYCQVIIVSNHPPRHFKLFAEDQALLDKFILVYLGADLQIPAAYRIPNMGIFLDSFASDLFNWAMHGKVSNLQCFIRAVSLNQLFEGEKDLRGIPGSIQSCMYQEDKSFLSLPELKTSIIKYSQLSSDIIQSVKDMNESAVGDVVVRVLSEIFGIKTKIQRYTKPDREIRPYGIANIAATDGSVVVPPDKTPLKPLKRGPEVDLGDPFQTEQVVVWMSNISRMDYLASIQEKILVERKQDKNLLQSD